MALAPGEGDDGIWTGSLVKSGDDIRIFYTSIQTPDFGIGKIRVATPNDIALSRWTKGPVVAEAPKDLDLIAFRDPFIRREMNGWRMFVGGGSKDGKAMALSYFSSDLEKWSYEGIVLSRSTSDRTGVWTGALWECPQFVKVGELNLMITSVWDNHQLYYAAYAQGDYKDGTFTATDWGRLTYGDSYYAPSFFVDAKGSPCLQFWMREISNPALGWAGAHSIPYRLASDSGDLELVPHPDIESFRVRCDSNSTESLTADLVWYPESGPISIYSGDELLVLAYAEPNDCIKVELLGKSHTLPVCGPTRFVLDGQIIEVSTGVAVLGAKIDPRSRNFTIKPTSETRFELFSLNLD